MIQSVARILGVQTTDVDIHGCLYDFFDSVNMQSFISPLRRHMPLESDMDMVAEHSARVKRYEKGTLIGQ